MRGNTRIFCVIVANKPLLVSHNVPDYRTNIWII